ncbi:MAG TPA: replication-relaxation family protein [Chloroflexia bacterium]|nr:replication-relaxation family protein [Chloroflexia bacterium]
MSTGEDRLETEKEATPLYKSQILGLLVRYRFLTSYQIWEKSGLLAGKSYGQTRVELARLKKMGLVRSLSVEKEKGRAAPHQWFLTPAGARLAGLASCPNYAGTSRLSRERIRLQGLQLDLEEQVALAGEGWRLAVPARHRVQPERSEQFHRLAAALNFKEYRETGKWPVNPYGSHTLGIPLRMSDYLAYSQPGGEFVVVLILCPPGAGRRFFESRIARYRALTPKVPVVALFNQESQAKLRRPLLEKDGVVALELKRLSEFLVAIF